MKTLAALALLAILGATAVRAEPIQTAQVFVERHGSVFGDPYDLPAMRQRLAIVPHDAIAAVRSLQLTPTSPPIRAGGAYVVHAIDHRGTPLRVFVDARFGDVVAVRPLAAPAPYRGPYGGPYQPPRYGVAPPEPYEDELPPRVSRVDPQAPPSVVTPQARLPAVAPQARRPAPRTSALTPTPRAPVPKPRPPAAPATAKAQPAPQIPPVAPPAASPAPAAPAPTAVPQPPAAKPEAPALPPVMPLDGP